MNKNTISKFIYTASFFIGLVMMLWGILIYESTFIDKKLLIILCLIPSLIVFVLIRDHYNNTYSVVSSFYAFAASIVSAGFLIISLFLICNFYFASDKSITKTYIVSEIGKLSGSSKSKYIYINHKDLSKQLILKKNTSIKKGNKIKIEISKGLLGLDVIRNKKIIE
ncbi:hypothetical protein [Tenacibaculum sp. M341]|uniref:hypothetical protein n=1 Tax=Tenacibaculum sp. M341 TaxID=2530339 RepID=UPI00104E5565|nr:hypothetical protein [Tenacibaculum sp. M341]TCI84527.1 hypothetical protein EYW44_21015 [Tenacibaculum sp. M341]